MPTEHEHQWETERWTYTGRRLNGKGQVMHAFVDENEVELTFSKPPPIAAVGAIFLVEVCRHEDGGMSARVQGATFEEEYDNTEWRATWQFLSREAMSRHGRDRAARKLTKDPDLERALAPLLAIVRRLNNRHEAYALGSYVTERITEAWWSK